MLSEKGHDDEYGIGNPRGFTILEVAQMYGSEIVMLPKRKGNRLVAPVASDKTRELG